MIVLDQAHPKGQSLRFDLKRFKVAIMCMALQKRNYTMRMQ